MKKVRCQEMVLIQLGIYMCSDLHEQCSLDAQMFEQLPSSWWRCLVRL